MGGEETSCPPPEVFPPKQCLSPEDPGSGQGADTRSISRSLKGQRPNHSGETPTFKTGQKIMEKRLQDSPLSHLHAWGLYNSGLTSQGGKLAKKKSRVLQCWGQSLSPPPGQEPGSSLVLAFLPPTWTPDRTAPPMSDAHTTKPLGALAPPAQWHLSTGIQHLER